MKCLTSAPTFVIGDSSNRWVRKLLRWLTLPPKDPEALKAWKSREPRAAQQTFTFIADETLVDYSEIWFPVPNSWVVSLAFYMIKQGVYESKRSFFRHIWGLTTLRPTHLSIGGSNELLDEWHVRSPRQFFYWILRFVSEKSRLLGRAKSELQCT